MLLSGRVAGLQEKSATNNPTAAAGALKRLLEGLCLLWQVKGALLLVKAARHQDIGKVLALLLGHLREEKRRERIQSTLV